ncbi:MAG: TRAP transporter large permease subunit [Deinococcota bacterium]
MLGLWMFAAAVVILLMGYPVAFSLGGTAVLFTLIGSDLLPTIFGITLPWAPEGVVMGERLFRVARLNALPQGIFGSIMDNYTLVAVPFFVFMGVMLEKSGLAEELLETMGILFGRLRGGLAISVVTIGALLAASTGVVGASVVTMGVLALPVMLKYNYDKGIATGVVASSGTLGQIIPPSIVLVILGDQIGVSVGDLFLGSFIPGFMLAGLFILWVIFVAFTKPDDVPALPEDARKVEPANVSIFVKIALMILSFALFYLIASAIVSLILPTVTFFEANQAVLPNTLHEFIAVIGLLVLYVRYWNAPLFFKVVSNLLPPFFLIIVVLATIFFGIATPTEAGAMGAVGAMILAAINRRLSLENLNEAMDQTVRLTSMVFVILIGATVFTLVFRALGGDRVITNFLLDLPGGSAGFLFFSMLIIFLLGFFIDFIQITFIVVPILTPIAVQVIGADPRLSQIFSVVGTSGTPFFNEQLALLWFGVIIAMNLQASFLTPPFGFALFYLKGVAPPSVQTTDIYRGIIPFIAIQLVALLLIIFFPQIVLWLPAMAR